MYLLDQNTTGQKFCLKSKHKIPRKSSTAANDEDLRPKSLSFQEHGQYDVPAMIDVVLNVTGLPRVMYIGYSMGTTSFFTMMSERPEYNDKVISFVGLAPAVYLDNMRSMATVMLKNLNLAVSLMTPS